MGASISQRLDSLKDAVINLEKENAHLRQIVLAAIYWDWQTGKITEERADSLLSENLGYVDPNIEQMAANGFFNG